jgi:hypothetical protein
MNRNQIAALNAAGEALKGLGLGRVSLAYNPPCPLVDHETYTVFVGAAAGICVGEGRTVAEAMENVLRQMPTTMAKAA